MKKTLLTLACALLTAGSATAQVCENYAGAFFSKVSNNGRFLVEDNQGDIRVYDRETQKAYEYLIGESENNLYTPGFGNAITNDGYLVGSDNQGCLIFYQGQILRTIEEPSGVGSTMNAINAISADGSRLAGGLTPDGISFGDEGIMGLPAIWNKAEDGTYKCVKLGYPAKDMFGLNPQRVTPYDMSGDGKVVVGQVVDNSGMRPYPIVWFEQEDGSWKWEILAENLWWDPEKLAALPPYPVEPTEPDASKYMSEEDVEKYNAAVAEYNQAVADAMAGMIEWEDVPENPESNKANYISDEAKNKEYIDALMQYEADNADYWTKLGEFQELADEATTGASMSYYTVFVSENGKYLASGFERADPNADPWDIWAASLVSPLLIDLSSPEKTVTIGDDTDHLVSSVADNGMLICNTPSQSYEARCAYVLRPGEKKAVSLYDYFKAEKADAAVKFLDENYRFDVTKVEYDEDFNEITSVVKDSLVTGTVFCTSDGKKFVGFMYNGYGEDYTTMGYYSYYIELNGSNSGTGLDQVATEPKENQIISREYFNMQGQRIAAPVNGLYIEKVTTTDGVVTKKCLK